MLFNTYSTELPSPTVYISEPTTGVAGDEFSLTCFVTTVPHLTSSAELSIVWSGGSVDRATESETIFLNGTTAVRNLTFSPLNTTHGAQYDCQAMINVSDIMVSSTESDRRILLVQSEGTFPLPYNYSVLSSPQFPVQW